MTPSAAPTRRALLASAAAASAVAACAHQPPQSGAAVAAPAADPAAPPNPALAAFFQATFERQLDARPELATSLGDKRNQHLWNPVGPDANREALGRLRADVAALQAQFGGARLNRQDEISIRLYRRLLTRTEAASPYEDYAYPYNQMFGAHAGAPTFLINQHKIETTADAEAYLSRLARMPGLLGAHLDTVERAAARGVSPPAHIYDYVISDCRNLIAGAPFAAGPDTPLWADFKSKIARLNLPDAEALRFLTWGEAVMKGAVGAAYAELIPALERARARARTTDGVWALPDGDAYYAERLALHTNTAMTAEEVHALGLAEVARLQGEMRAIMAQVGFAGDLQAFFRFMETDPRFFLPATAEGRAEYIRRATAAIDAMRAKVPEAFDLTPRAPMVVRAVEPFRERSAGLAFYQRPSPDGTRPGVYYVNTFNMAAIPTYQIEALAFHEGIPGHHFQIAIAQELAGLPRFRQTGAGGSTAYAEGWALYTERLAKEMGFYQDPYSDFGRLTLELRRAIRLVVDTGLHAKRWPRAQAIRYILDNQPGDEPSAARDIDRYIVMPGQACAYLIGQREILRLREAARARLGARFDLRVFHSLVLGQGALPLEVLAEEVDRWTA